MTHYASISNQTLIEVGESWTQDNADKFAWTKLPRCTVRGMAAGQGTTTYNLPNVDNFLLKTDGMQEWGYGLARRAPRDLASTAVTVSPSVEDIAPLTRPLTSSAESDSIWMDLQANVIPGQLSLLYQGIEKRLAALLTNGQLGTSTNFSAGTALDTYMTNVDHDPLGDILAALESNGLRWKASATGGSIAMFISPRVLDLFQRHPAFSGSGRGNTGGVAQVVSREQVLDHIGATLGVDEVITMGSVADQVRLGATSAPTIEGRSVLAFQILDRNRSRNLASNPFDVADGSVTYFEAEAPNVTVAQDEDTKVVKFNGDCEFSIGSPRGATWGIYFPASEMFT